MRIAVASTNAHKLGELAALFPGHDILTPESAGCTGFDVEEDGHDYLSNALKKARALFAATGMPSLADDSGLSVRALGGGPGVRSARYGSPDGIRKLDTAERNALLLAAMEREEDRACAFVCCLVLLLPEDRFFVVQETCPGILLRSPRGEGGFGYDPVVFLPELGKSVAELTAGEKNMVSHRGRAAGRLARIIQDTAFPLVR